MRVPSPQRFAAPLGLRVRLLTWLSLGLCPAICLVNLVLVRFGTLPPPDAWIVVLAPLIGLPVIGLVVLLSRIRGFRVEGTRLIVERVGRATVLDLAGLLDATVDRAALRWAWKTCGNDGAGAICGRFYSRRLGSFRAFVTDPANAVLLRWPDHTVVVSPARPAAFVADLRRRTGL